LFKCADYMGFNIGSALRDINLGDYAVADLKDCTDLLEMYSQYLADKAILSINNIATIYS